MMLIAMGIRILEQCNYFKFKPRETYIKAMWPLFFLFCCATSSCHRDYSVSSSRMQLPYKVHGADDTALISIQKQLAKQGVKVVSMGQNYLISIPSDALFPNESPRLMWGSYGLLNEIACYLKEFRKIEITVTAYSTKCVSERRDHALTLARARAVSDYLWSQDMNSRFIFSQGLGAEKPIAAGQGGDHSINSRIEIVFRDAVLN